MARQKDPQSRTALIAAARGEFARVGVLRARIEDITNACGLSKGAVYLHFESQEALFRELARELQRRIDGVNATREEASRALLAGGLPDRKNATAFVAALLALEGEKDRGLLEALWEWRDVTAVLLSGSQGTEFEGVMWTILDREAARIELQGVAMQQAGLMHPEVPPELMGAMVIGTWLMVSRRLSKLTQKPDFEPWVGALQSVIADGAASGNLRVQRDAARHASIPRRGRRAAPDSPAKRQRR